LDFVIFNMRTLISKLKRCRVETVSGTYLGKVRDIEMDVESHLIVQYLVSLWPGQITHRIHRNQVVRIESAKIVVEDVVLREPLGVRANDVSVVAQSQVAIMAEE
jgi:sporulation protein YlmC with PRC-barrel domain